MKEKWAQVVISIISKQNNHKSNLWCSMLRTICRKKSSRKLVEIDQ